MAEDVEPIREDQATAARRLVAETGQEPIQIAITTGLTEGKTYQFAVKGREARPVLIAVHL